MKVVPNFFYLTELDLLAIGVLTLMAGVVLLLRLRGGSAASASTELPPHPLLQADPMHIPLPMTGLGDGGGLAYEGAYVPLELTLLLASKMDAASLPAEARELATAMQPQVPTASQSLPLQAQSIFTALVILLGLAFLLFWLISVF